MPDYGDLPYGFGDAPFGFGPFGGDLVITPYDPPIIVGPTITTPQEALDATHTTTAGLVFVGGVTVDATAWDCQFGVDAAIATARITVPLPRPASVVANAEVLIQGGHNDLVGPLFSGRVPAWESSMTLRGDTLTIRAVGWCSLLNYRERFDLTYDGPITLSALFDSLCARRGVPSYRADTVTDPSGSIVITLGGNPQIDDGKVIVPASQSPLTFLNNAAEPFGYRVYDTPDGTVRLSRVSGLPNTDPVVTFTEGVHLLSARSTYDITGIVNYWDVYGQTYEDALGATVPIRAFPAAIPSDPLIPVNEGVSYREYRSSLLVTQQMAEIVRQRLEIDTSEPDTPVRWEAVAVPGVSVGDVVRVDCDAVEANGDYWLTDLDITGTDGLTATYSGWLGAGSVLPAGDDSLEQLIQTGVTHLGDETLAHYAVPAPNGNVSKTRQKWTVTLPDRATAATLRFWHHGTNSQLVGGVQTDLEVSQFKVYEAGSAPDDDDVRPVTSGRLAVLNEDLARRYPYNRFTVTDGVVTDPGYWKPGAVNLSRLDAGTYDLYLDAGDKNGHDDFEVRYLWLVTYGTNEPVILPQETT